MPKLTEAKDDVFVNLAGLTRPQHVWRIAHRYKWASLLFSSASREPRVFNAASVSLDATAGSATTGIEVLSRQRVAGYDATVLAADNAKALNRWLQRHGYVADASFEKWLQPYIARGWKITAFKMARDKPAGEELNSSAVQMSFRTAQPVFPYREPAAQRTGKGHDSRTLRVFFLGTQRVQGRLGEKFNWPGRVEWTSSLDEKTRKFLPAIAQSVGRTDRQKWWMTVFEDRSSPRPGFDDVFFQPGVDQSSVRPAPIVHYKDVWIPIPVEPVLLILFGAGLLWRHLILKRRDVLTFP
jgi:hypothetical protein